MAVVKQAGQSLGQEIRRKLVRSLLAAATIILVMTIVITMVVAGVLHLSDALMHVYSEWLGNRILGDALCGLSLTLIPFLILLMVRLRFFR